jgi:hypothetical protein
VSSREKLDSGIFLAAHDLYRRYRWHKDRADLDVLMAEAVATASDGPEYLLYLINWFGSMPVCPHRDQTPMADHSSHAGMPSLHGIFAYWHARPGEAGELFGDHVGAMMRQGLFCCFGCTRPTSDHGVRGTLQAGDYERAHLQDACLKGPNTPENLAPLCHVCHSRMTDHFSGCRRCAAEWVKWLNGGTCACHSKERAS